MVEGDTLGVNGAQPGSPERDRKRRINTSRLGEGRRSSGVCLKRMQKGVSGEGGDNQKVSNREANKEKAAWG